MRSGPCVWFLRTCRSPLLVVAVDREAVAAKDGGKVSPIATGAGERYCCSASRVMDGSVVMRGRFLLLFLSAIEAGVPMMTNYVLDGLLATPPTSSSSSTLP